MSGLTQQQLLWNPNSIPANAIAPTYREPHEAYKEMENDVRRYAIEKSLVENAKTVTSTLAAAKAALRAQRGSDRLGVSANLTFALDVKLDPSGRDHGMGGLLPKDPTAAILTALTIDGGRGEITKDRVAKAIKSWWPRCPSTGLPMHFIGSLNLGTWSQVFRDMTLNRLDQWMRFSPYGIVSNGSLDSTHEVALCLWVSYQNDFNSSLPDCAVQHRCLAYYDKPYTLEDLDVARELIAEEQARSKYESGLTATPPAGSVERITFKVDPDPMPKNGEREVFKDTPEVECFEFKGEVKVFGQPRSQQTPRRPLLQNSYPVCRAMSPLVSFNDTEGDVTHQMYGCMAYGEFDSDAYGKLDSSNT